MVQEQRKTGFHFTFVIYSFYLWDNLQSIIYDLKVIYRAAYRQAKGREEDKEQSGLTA